MEQYMPYLWLLVAVALTIVEITTAQLVSIWFVLAAVVTAVCSATFLKGIYIWQFVVFVFVSALCIALTKPLVERIKSTHKTKTNSDRHIGKVGKVIVTIDPAANTGLVEVDGSRWSAKSADSSIIEKDTSVVVDSIEGVKLIVTAR